MSAWSLIFLDKTGADISQWTYAWAVSQKDLAPWVTYLETTSSTSDLAKEYAAKDLENNSPLRLWIAKTQTQGRGRNKNTWINPAPGTGLLSSWSFSSKELIAPTFTAKIGLALIKSLASSFPHLPWNLKAPNDIYLGQQKVAGILIENVLIGSQTRVIIGIGFNVLAHPQSISTSTSLSTEAPSLELDSTLWSFFLNRLQLELNIAITHIHQKISSNDCQALRHFLNLHPLLEEHYHSVQPDGSLRTDSKTIHWMEL